MQMDDKLKRRLAGAAVLIAATFVIVSILPTPEQAAQQPGVDVVTIPLHEVVSHEPPPPAAQTTPPTLAAPPPPVPDTHDGDGTDAQEVVDSSGDDDGANDSAEARKPVQLALDSSLQNRAESPAKPEPADKPHAPAVSAAPKPEAAKPAAAKPAEPTLAKPATPPVEKSPAKAQEPVPGKPVEKAAEKPAAKPADKPGEAPKSVDKTTVAAKPADRPADKPAATAGGWAVQVGGFADISRARSVQDKLKALGQASFISPIDTAKGTLYRVRSGPYTTRELALAAQSKLNGNGYPEARVVAP